MLKWFLNICTFLGALYIVGYVFALITGFFHYLVKQERTENFLYIFWQPIKTLLESVREYSKDTTQQKILGTIFVITVAIGIVWAPISIFYQREEVGSLLEKRDYTARYYVNLFPEEHDSKNYRVSADIQATKESYNDGDTSYSYRVYYIERAYFPNGGSVSFEDNGYNESLVVGEKISVLDDDGKEWYVELTSEKVK